MLRTLAMVLLAALSCSDGGTSSTRGPDARGAHQPTGAFDAFAPHDAPPAARRDARAADAGAPRGTDAGPLAGGGCAPARNSPRCTNGFFCNDSQTCWTIGVDCATARDCDGNGVLETACACGTQVDCTTRSCGNRSVPARTCARPVTNATLCPSSARPYYCPNQDCCVQTADVDCASLRDCDGDGVFDITCACGTVVGCSPPSCSAP